MKRTWQVVPAITKKWKISWAAKTPGTIAGQCMRLITAPDAVEKATERKQQQFPV